MAVETEGAEKEMNALDKALVAWGVKAAPGEPEVDLKQKIKSAGVAGAAAYGLTELGFWVISIPLAVFGYHQTTGEWLDLSTVEGKEELFGLSAGFLTFARLVVPLRIAAALALTPAMDKYVIKRFFNKGDAAAPAEVTSEGPGPEGAVEVAMEEGEEGEEVPTAVMSTEEVQA
ncbi:unnamed protein product [Discosporangium mesarthrocarpum]